MGPTRTSRVPLSIEYVTEAVAVLVRQQIVAVAMLVEPAPVLPRLHHVDRHASCSRCPDAINPSIEVQRHTPLTIQ
jgi:hypothetical protein